jgi:hypothetical protein
MEQKTVQACANLQTFFALIAAADLHIPNACNVCHADKTPEWAGAVMKNWVDRSPWRLAK